MVFPEAGTLPQTIPLGASQTKQETSRSIFMALRHGPTELMPAEIKLSKGGHKDQIAFSLLPHFPSFNADFYHCAYEVRSHGGKKILFFFWSPENHLRDTISTGHTESCHTLSYVPTYPVGDGSAHPQLLVTPSGR